MEAHDTSDFEALLREVDTLAATVNPDANPYESQYRIIEILNKWLTTPLREIETAIGHAKLGATYLQVEEPHNAQPALEKAGTFFYPELQVFASTVANPESTPTPAASVTDADLHALLDKLPKVDVPDDRHYVRHVLESLTQTGILWFNRSLPLRALCYFKACTTLCGVVEATATPEAAETIVALRTHAYFYLAQVYGSLQRADASALYCLATLEMQLLSHTSTDGVHSVDKTAVHEWIKNALRLVDYYIDIEDGAQASLCLYASEYLLINILQHQQQDGDDHGDDDEVTVDELAQRRGEVYLAWAKLHQQTLQLAQLHRDGLPLRPVHKPIAIADQVVRRVPLNEILHRLVSGGEEEGEGPPLRSLSKLQMHYVSPATVTTYDHARDVYKMGAAAADTAMQVFVLDGYVTAHIQLLQLQSQLYRRLIAYEPQLKRQIAMHLRRLALLSPLLGDVVNPQAYCAKLQELYYESAETAVEIYDLKQHKTTSTSGGGSTDHAKATAYLLKAIHWYQEYLFLFYPTGTETANDRKELVGGDHLIIGGPGTPLPTGAASMTPAEFKSVLHGFFSLARACGKVLMAKKDQDKTVFMWRKAILYHEAVLALVKKYRQVASGTGAGDQLAGSFQAEMEICEEMIELMPAKIDQLVFNGRTL